MNVCPNCFSTVQQDVSNCPFCGFVEATDDVTIRRSTWKTILQFTLIAGFLMGSILLVDRIAGGALYIPSQCGENEQCLISGLSVCNVMKAEPHTYGIQEVEIKGKQGSLCVVDVHLYVQDNLYDGTKAVEKTCAFPLDSITALGVKDLFTCKHFDGGTSHDKNLIQGAFLPMDEQVPQ